MTDSLLVWHVAVQSHNKQPTNNQPSKKSSFPQSIITFQGLRFYQCCHLASYVPKRLETCVEVKQKGYWWPQL